MLSKSLMLPVKRGYNDTSKEIRYKDGANDVVTQEEQRVAVILFWTWSEAWPSRINAFVHYIGNSYSTSLRDHRN